MTPDDVKKMFEGCETVIPDRLDHLLFAAERSNFSGLSLEFGVWEGKSLSALAQRFPGQAFVGFDSFDGLPAEWVRSFDGTRKSVKGEFALPSPPQMASNVDLVVGQFIDTLPKWSKKISKEISFLHVDSDLYSSASTILTCLNDHLVAGSVIVFDEMCDWLDGGVYDRWREGEMLALCEWMESFGRRIEPLARTDWIEGSVVVSL